MGQRARSSCFVASATAAVVARRGGQAAWAQPVLHTHGRPAAAPLLRGKVLRHATTFASWRSPLAASMGLGFGSLLLRGARGRRACLRHVSTGAVLGRVPRSRGARQSSLLLRHSAAVADQAEVKTVADKVLAPARDPRSYRVVQLPNGLQVLLCSDGTTDVGAAAVSLRCGTFQDPDDRLGLAHFHEHMLFLGTEKYPKEDEYHKYLSEHGGDSNAFTMSEYTTYYFKVASPYLDGALDRFAQFFVSPKFNLSNVEREMKVVDSESTNYSTEDGWRLLQVLKTSAEPQHPFSRFDVGNVDTLGFDDLDRTRSQLVDWNKSHYQAGAMQLVVVGRESLDELQQSIVEKFSPVRSGPGKEQLYPCLPWPQKQLGRIVSCVPIKEARSISACWPMPPPTKHLYAKPELYLAHMLGHEGEGSLHNLLNMLGWVDQLQAGSSHSFSDEQLFAINISLTPEGDAHREKVLALMFEYVDIIRKAGPQEAIYKELAALQEIGFAHKEDTPAPDDFAAGAAMSLHRYPGHEVLRGPFALDEWKPDVVDEYLSTLTPERCLVFLTSDAFVDESSSDGAAELGWKSEEWYKASYKEETFTQEQLNEWNASLEAALGGQPTGLRIPKPNPFVPSDFSLCTQGEGASQAELSRLPMDVTPPEPLLDEPMLRVWHKSDKAFKTPREYVLTHIHTAAYDLGPETVAMMRLFCGVVMDDLNTFGYDASVAGLGYNLEFSDNLSMALGGFSHKLPELLKVVIQRLGQVLDDASQAARGEEAMGDRGQELLEKLEVQRQILLQDYSNFTREDPSSVGAYYLSQLMGRNSWHLSEYMKVLEKPPDLASFEATVRKALSRVQVDVLVHGNVKADAARLVASAVCDAFKGLGASPLTDFRRKEVTKLPLEGTAIFEYDLAKHNPAQENCCTQNVYEVGPTNEDLKRDACVTLTCHIAHTSVFQKLRTEQQLGYIVQAFPWVENHVCGLSVLVQGNRLHPKEVDLRIEEWLESFGHELESMSEEDFQNNVKGVVNERTQRYASMMQETHRHWSEILPRRYQFERLAAATEAIQALSKEDVADFFKQYIAAGSPGRRKLSVRTLGTSAGEERSTPEKPEDVLMTSLEELRAFQKGSEFYPARPPSPMPSIPGS